MKSLILASGSKARRQILEQAGIPFRVEVSDYEEDMSIHLSPAELARHLSQGKARAVAKYHKEAVILAADSFAVLNGQLLGKPHTKARAHEMLISLSGKSHTFVTGFTLIDTTTGEEYSGDSQTTVYFRVLTPAEIDGYLAKEDVLNNAAAYKIQALGASLVERIEGDYMTVMGLPLSEIVVPLRRFGIELL